MYGFDSILHSVYLPMNGLYDALDISRNHTNVAADRSHLDADRIDQFLCFFGSPANLEKDRDEENRATPGPPHDGNADRHQCFHGHLLFL